MKNMVRRLLILALLVAPGVRAAAAASLAQSVPEAADCRSSFSVSKLMKDRAGNDASVKLAADDMRWKLLAYYKWRAFGAGDVAECAPMKSLIFLTDIHGPVGGDLLCRDLYHRLAFVRGYVERAPDLRRLCLENVVNEGDRPDAEQMRRYEKACDIIIRPDVPVEERCAQAISYMPFPPEKRPKHVRRCVCDYGSMMGSEKCHEDPGNNPEGFLGPERYDSELAFRAAYAAKNVKLCGSLELCRGLMGEAPAMAQAQAAKIADIVCAGRR